ncbi:hypothetical protein F511_22672 [Dorcoceras hygrometricum]|uniref:Uncharacterized protein n=1 Tax=Dorcoceras hygrometricum TaxID=472368 RepID=A0A2Z7CRC3_9LAMI|nr:hypothetical protein F511_22672 [Dorcoceras hygrometricum]
MTSAVTSSFSRELQLEIQQMRRGAKFGLSCDDISLDVITISRWIQQMMLSAKEKRRRVLNQQMKQSVSEEATSYGDSAGGLEVDDVIGDVIQSQESAADEATVHPVATQSIQSQEDPVASNSSIQSQEDSGEAFDDPVASNSSIQSRSVKSVAKQLTICEKWKSTAELNSNGESDKKQSTLKMERFNG